MRSIKNILAFLLLMVSVNLSAQCNQSLTVNSIDSSCNGNGTSTVTINISVTFGGGNNSVTISYNLGALEVYMVIIEDNLGNFTNMDFMFDVPSCDNYTVSLIAWPNPSGGGNMCTSPAPVVSNMVLPVTFGDVEAISGKHEIMVKWNTLSEVNNNFFTVEKSSSGNQFKSIGKVSGSGNSNNLVTYSLVDDTPNIGNNIYRIKQVDYDGRHNYSEVISVYFEDSDQIVVYPNPFDEYFQIEADRNAKFYLMNAVGQTLNEIKLTSKNQKINTSALPVGSYYLLDSNFNIVNRLIKI